MYLSLYFLHSAKVSFLRKAWAQSDGQVVDPGGGVVLTIGGFGGFGGVVGL